MKKFTVFFLLALFIITGCQSTKENDNLPNIESHEDVDSKINNNIDSAQTYEAETETTTEDKKNNFEFLKTNGTILTENDFKRYSGYSSGDSIIYDINEIEYEEFNSESGTKKFILDNEHYTVYYYENENNSTSGNVYVIDKQKNADKASILVKNFFGFYGSKDYTGEYFIKGDILWVKFSTSSLDKDVQNKDNYTDESFYRPSQLHSQTCDTWNAIDLSANKGAVFGQDASLTNNKEYYYYVSRDWEAEHNILVVGNTSDFNHTEYEYFNHAVVAEDGTIIDVENNTIYSIFKNDNQRYAYIVDGDLLYVSENAIYVKNNYGIMKYTNTNQDLVIKFIDYGKNTEVLRYIVDYSNSPYFMLKSETMEEIINLDNY